MLPQKTNLPKKNSFPTAWRLRTWEPGHYSRPSIWWDHQTCKCSVVSCNMCCSPLYSFLPPQETPKVPTQAPWFEHVCGFPLSNNTLSNITFSLNNSKTCEMNGRNALRPKCYQESMYLPTLPELQRLAASWFLPATLKRCIILSFMATRAPMLS